MSEPPGQWYREPGELCIAIIAGKMLMPSWRAERKRTVKLITVKADRHGVPSVIVFALTWTSPGAFL